MDDAYDLFVIGAGSGGVRAARVAGALGARVAVAEVGRLGGTCVNLGCVPKKLMAQAAAYAADFEDARGFGWTLPDAAHSWQTLIAAKDREIERLNAGYGRTLQSADVELLQGHASFVDAHTLRVGERSVRARHVLIATGARPRRLEVPGAELAMISDDVFSMPALPPRVLIVGAGYIALEFAGIFRGLGAEVVLVHRSSALLRGFDADLQAAALSALRARGVDVHLERHVQRIEHDGDGLSVVLEDDERLTAAAVLMAIGREPLVAGLGLDRAGVSVGERGEVVVDAACRTSVPHIYAVGDVRGGLELTPLAIKEGQAVAQTLFGPHPVVADRAGVPTAVFSQPPIATVGMTEAQARAAVEEIAVYRSSFRPLKHTLSGRADQTLMKLVVDVGSGRVLGCHMLGPDAPEIVQGFAVAMKAGATKAQLDATLGIHPTAAEEFVTMR